MKLFRILGVISCAALAFANDFFTDTHFDQSPMVIPETKTIVNGKLRYKSNSHICETTPGVGQKSGYITVGKNMSMVSRLQGYISHSMTSFSIVVLVL